MSMTTTPPTAALDPEERSAVLAAVREFAQARLAPHALEWDEKKHFPRAELGAAGELGLGGLNVREDVGGSAFARVDSVAVVEELAYADPAVAAYITIHNMVAWMIDRYGTDAQRTRWLPRLVAMQDFGAYCLTEPGAGSDAAAITTSAVRDGDEFVLTGVKQFISGGGEAAVYVVMARTALRQAQGPERQVQGPERKSAGISAFVVPAESAGLSFGQNEKKMGWNAQPTRQVIFDEVRVPASALLGDLGGGFKIAMSALNGGRISIAACSLGGAQWALDRAIQYVHERFTFGEALAQKQTVVFALADMATQLRAARALVRDAALAMDSRAPDVALQCAMAKRFATDAGFTVANEALQLHGGYGYLHDYGIEKVVRDLRVHQILEGTNEIMRLIIGRELLEG